MIYAKPSLSPPEQADLLIRRGIQGNRDQIIQRLSAVSYYRLSGYSHPFRQPDDSFRPGTKFETVWQRYVFDRRLRLLVMDAVERIEVAVRSQLALHHSQLHGPFAYATDPESLPKLDGMRRSEFLSKLAEETRRSREVFVRHFQEKYGDNHAQLPIWMMAEIMSFGNTLTFFKGCSRKVKTEVSTVFQVPDKVFESWLLTLNTVRNICAHHGRLWNRELGVRPWIPRREDYPDWHSPVTVSNNKVFAILTLCRHSLKRIAPQSRWKERMNTLLAEYPEIPLPAMGFPEGWEASPIWG